MPSQMGPAEKRRAGRRSVERVSAAVREPWMGPPRALRAGARSRRRSALKTCGVPALPAAWGLGRGRRKPERSLEGVASGVSRSECRPDRRQPEWMVLVQARGGVDRDAVYSDLEVEVGAGGSAGHAYCADCLAALDVLALADEDLRAVAVEGGHRAAVVDDDRVAVAAAPAGEDDAAARARGDRGALGGAYVDAGVHL